MAIFHSFQCAMIFNASERKGVLILLFLITGLLIIPRQFLPKDSQVFLLPLSAEIYQDSLIVQQDSTSKAIPLKPFRKNGRFQPVELNTADSSTLTKVKGIGPYYASKIIRYRNRLGGYYALQQLKELKMTYFNVDSAAHFLCIDTSLITKRNLDSMDFKAILRHPYLEYEDVQMIFKAKQKYGQLSYQLLKEKGVLPAYKLKKIRPYFK